MANPVNISCPKNQWTKVASSVQTGTINVNPLLINAYFRDYRITGDLAPTDDSTAILIEGKECTINHTENIDIYIKCIEDGGYVIVSL
jgi:hypothetical protein